MQRVVHSDASRCMQESGTIVPQACAVCLDDIVRCVTGGEKKERMNKNIRKVVNMSSQHGVEVLVDPLKKRKVPQC